MDSSASRLWGGTRSARARVRSSATVATIPPRNDAAGYPQGGGGFQRNTRWTIGGYIRDQRERVSKLECHFSWSACADRRDRRRQRVTREDAGRGYSGTTSTVRAALTSGCRRTDASWVPTLRIGSSRRMWRRSSGV